MNNFYNLFKSDINNCIKKNILTSTFKYDDSKGNLLSSHIIKLIKENDKFKTKFKRSGNIIGKNNMYHLKEIIKEEIVDKKQIEM